MYIYICVCIFFNRSQFNSEKLVPPWNQESGKVQKVGIQIKSRFLVPVNSERAGGGPQISVSPCAHPLYPSRMYKLLESAGEIKCLLSGFQKKSLLGGEFRL